MTPLPALLVSALDHVASVNRDAAMRLVVMQQIGFGEMEIARALGITWRAFDAVRSELQGATIRALRADGYESDAEIARYLHVSVEDVERHGHEPTCMRGLSGEPEWRCQCRAIREQRKARAQRDHEDAGEARDGW